jgi:hypothetical protein
LFNKYNLRLNKNNRIIKTLTLFLSFSLLGLKAYRQILPAVIILIKSKSNPIEIIPVAERLLFRIGVLKKS